jgi:hypothetical protein
MTLLRLLLPAMTFAAISSVAMQNPSQADLVTVVVSDVSTGGAVAHPMICVREFPQPFGAIGDSAGRATFGGNLPAGTLHLRIKAPQHLDFDTTASWPSTSEIRVKLKRRSGPSINPQC